MCSLEDPLVVAYRRSIIEECAAGAVVEKVPRHPVSPWTNEPTVPWGLWDSLPAVPVANAPASLAEDVARELVGGGLCDHCPTCSGDDGTGCVPTIPFAAAYHDAGGVRTYVLVSRECGRCAGLAVESTSLGVPHDGGDAICGICQGTGATTNVRSIADRYQPDRPWRDEDTLRRARFEVML